MWQRDPELSKGVTNCNQLKLPFARYRNSDDPRFAIQNWMRNRNTIEFLGLWETLHNPNFNRVQFDTFKNEAGLNRFVMTPSCQLLISPGYLNCPKHKMSPGLTSPTA